MRVRLAALLLLCSPAIGQTDAVPTFGTTVFLPSGLRGDIYYLDPGTPKLPKFKKSKSVGTLYTNSLYVPPRVFTDGFPGVTNRFEWFAIDYQGRFWIENPGRYTFRLESDDGSILYIDKKRLIDNDGIHPPVAKENTVKLAEGTHEIRVSYFQGPASGIALMLSVEGPDDPDFRPFSTERFRRPGQASDGK